MEENTITNAVCEEKRKPQIAIQLDFLKRETELLISKVEELKSRLEPAMRKGIEGKIDEQSEPQEILPDIPNNIKKRAEEIKVANYIISDILERLEI